MALERFNPNLVGDVHRWIPEGLPYDLIDDRNEQPTLNFIDNVNGYNINKCFGALQYNIQSIPAYTNTLLLQNGNWQAAEVNQLRTSYNY